MTSSIEKTYRYGCVAVDTCIEIVSVIPLQTKQPSDVVEAMIKTFEQQEYLRKFIPTKRGHLIM